MKTFKVWLSPPHMSGAESAFISEAFATNWIGPLGPNVDKFEEEICDYIGDGFYGAALSSGTAAIHLALILHGIKPGDYVLCSSLTFAGSAFPIQYCGAKPIFVDSDTVSWNMSPAALEKAIQESLGLGIRPKACIAVDLYGQSADYDAIHKLCRKHDIILIEDAAEALGASYQGRKCGSFGSCGIFSFNGNKIITSSSGGMLVSRDEALIKEAKKLATQARDSAPYYQHSRTGYNYRLSNICAGIGRGQLTVIDERVNRRRAIYERYESELHSVPGIQFMPEASYGVSNRWLTTLTIDPSLSSIEPNIIIAKLAEKGIEARPIWKPLHLQPIFNDCPYFSEAPQQDTSRKLFEQGMCLPSGSSMSETEQGLVIHELKDILLRGLRSRQ